MRLFHSFAGQLVYTFHLKSRMFSWEIVLLCMSVYCHFSCTQLFVTLSTVAHQALCQWDSPGKNTGVGCHVLYSFDYLFSFILSFLSVWTTCWSDIGSLALMAYASYFFPHLLYIFVILLYFLQCEFSLMLPSSPSTIDATLPQISWKIHKSYCDTLGLCRITPDLGVTIFTFGSVCVAFRCLVCLMQFIIKTIPQDLLLVLYI